MAKKKNTTTKKSTTPATSKKKDKPEKEDPEDSISEKEDIEDDESEEKPIFKELAAPTVKVTKIDVYKRRIGANLKKRKKTLKYYLSNKIKPKFIQLKEKINPQEEYDKNKEPPKSFAFKKEFIGLYIFFLFYSFLMLFSINDINNIVIYTLTFFLPFEFATTMIAFFITLSIILSHDKIRYWIFDNEKLQMSYAKQLAVFIPIFTMLFLFISIFIMPNFNITTIILLLSMFWLFLLASKFYKYARRFSTNIEEKFISKYTKSRSIIATAGPYIIIALLIVMSLLYRTFIVLFTLEFLGAADPAGAILVYQTEMTLIMPLIYVSLILTFLFITIEFIFSRRLAETKRAGKFDNFTFSLIVFFIFFFQLMQVSLFLFMRPETVNTISNVISTGSGTTYVFIFEFIISMFFLYRILVKTGQTFGWRLIFFKKDGVVLLILTCVFAQTVTEYANALNYPGQDLTFVGDILQYSKFLISIIMILILGSTLVIYYLKPQQTSMFMRMRKETVREEEKEIEQIYAIIKNEYIRRGEGFSLKSLEKDLVKALRVPIATINELLVELSKKYIDIALKEEKDEKGKFVTYFIDFISILDTYEKKDVANKKAQKFLSERLFDTMSTEKKKISSTKGLDKDKAGDQLLSSLTSKFAKERRKVKGIENKAKKAQRTLVKTRDVSDSLQSQIHLILRKEYIYRIETKDKYPDFHFPISEVAYEIQKQTKISPGELYPVMEAISKSDIEIKLKDNPEEPNDKKVMFYPVADDAMIAAIRSFRPEEYPEIVHRMTHKFAKAITTRKTITRLKNVKKGIKKRTDKEMIWAEIISYFIKNYLTYKKNNINVLSKKSLNALIAKFPKKKNKNIYIAEKKSSTK